jgi:hypothetical protein
VVPEKEQLSELRNRCLECGLEDPMVDQLTVWISGSESELVKAQLKGATDCMLGRREGGRGKQWKEGKAGTEEKGRVEGRGEEGWERAAQGGKEVGRRGRKEEGGTREEGKRGRNPNKK